MAEQTFQRGVLLPAAILFQSSAFTVHHIPNMGCLYSLNDQTNTLLFRKTMNVH